MNAIIDDKITREEVSVWAAKWVTKDDVYYKTENEVYDVLKNVAKSSLVIDNEYICKIEDFKAWKDQLAKLYDKEVAMCKEKIGL